MHNAVIQSIFAILGAAAFKLMIRTRSSWDTASVRECYTPVDVVRDWRKEERVVRVSTPRDVHKRKWSPAEDWISNSSEDSGPWDAHHRLLSEQSSS